MSEFIDAFSEIIGTGYGQKAAFCRATGCSDSYLTDILKGRQLIPPATLAGYLEKWDAPEEGKAALIRICSRAKAEKQKGALPEIAALQGEVDALRADLASLIAIMRQDGLEIPDDIAKRVDPG